ncbi:CYTH domain-containing protein [Patescibacteria group bacterium]|nr:CYTH domain-containing protein [Patescibacteria group bacterium]
MKNFLKGWAFRKWEQSIKKREQYQLGDFNICLDQVKNIGNFVEIELMVKRGSEKKTMVRCWQLADKLGFSKRDEFGYWLCDIAVGKVKWPPSS